MLSLKSQSFVCDDLTIYVVLFHLYEMSKMYKSINIVSRLVIA